MIDLTDYFDLNIIKHSQKLFQVMMNNTGNIIVMELTNDGYVFPQLADLLEIKDQIYQADERCCSNGRKKRTIAVFITIALIGTSLVGVKLSSLSAGNPVNFSLFQLDKGERHEYPAFAYDQYEEDIDVLIDKAKPLTTVKELRAVFNEVITKEDLITIVNEKNWDYQNKSLMVEFINLLPADQDLFILKHNLQRMNITTYTAESWAAAGKNPDHVGYFYSSTGNIEYIADAKNENFQHEAMHAVCLFRGPIEGYEVYIFHEPYNGVLMEVANMLSRKLINNKILSSELTSIYDEYGEAAEHFTGYLYYYGPETIIEFYQRGNIDGFIPFATEDFPDARKHISYIELLYSDKQMSEDQFYELMRLTYECFLQYQKRIFDEHGYFYNSTLFDSLYNKFNNPQSDFNRRLFETASKKGLNPDLSKCTELFKATKNRVLPDYEFGKKAA